ncbi:MAG TPA: DUF456 domain-containing protein [Chthoniobacterales bacterium]|jgi:hypothetical protein
MDAVIWSVIALLMVAGVVGTLVPLVPGHILILAGAVVHRMVLKEEGVGWITLGILTVLVLVGFAVDFLSGAAGAKYFGATRWGALGGILGAVVGIFFGLIGMIAGPLIGVLAGELLGGKGLLPAGKSTWGTFLGGVAGAVVKLAVALVMVAVFLTSVFVMS